MPGILHPYTANDPQPFNHFDSEKEWFAADGVPILPIDNAGQLNAYPLMRVSATNPETGKTLASLDVVLPVACEGCHGSTHAIWPNALASANDNLAAIQLQGHTGSIIECSTCHTSLPLTLNGPHGMHNVNSTGWNLEHEDFYEKNPNACRACHGTNLEGTELSRTAADRDYLRDDDGDRSIHLTKGTPVSCGLCHEKP